MNASLTEVATDDLCPGMFIAAVDQPICNTPFPMRGFYIKDDDDIAKVEEYCDYVFIDFSKSTAVNLFGGNLLTKAKAKTKAKTRRKDGNSPTARGGDKHYTLTSEKITYSTGTSLAEELKTASVLFKHLQKSMSQACTSINESKPIDVSGFSSLAKTIVDSILRNPNALILVACTANTNLFATRNLQAIMICIRAAITGIAFGREIGLNKRQLQTLLLGILFAKIGCSLPGAESEKPQDERTLLITTYKTIQNLKGMDRNVVEVIANQLEKENGEGFPKKRSGKDIPLLGKIGAISLHYHHLLETAKYSTKPVLGNAIAELNKTKGELFNEELVEEFVKTTGIYPVGSLVRLNSKQVGLVVCQCQESKLKPQVLLLPEPGDKTQKTAHIINLNSPENHRLTISDNLRGNINEHTLNALQAALCKPHNWIRATYLKIGALLGKTG